MAGIIVDVWAIRPLPEAGKWQELPALGAAEKEQVIERAAKFGYSEESSIVPQPSTSRIKLNDPNNEGYHRDYIVRFE